MTAEILEERQKRKGKKTYEELLEEAKNIASKTAAVFIPELCQALKDESPDISNDDIKQKVITDCEGIWAYNTIRVRWPSWVLDDVQARRAKKGWETRHAEETNRAIKNIAQLSEMKLPVPKIEVSQAGQLGNDEDEYKHEFEPIEVVKQPEPEQEYVGSFYTDGLELTGDLIKILTHQKRTFANVTKLEGIEQSKDYRLKSMKRMSETDLCRMQNYLSFLRDVINDTLPMIDRELETKKEKDTLLKP